MIDEDYRPIPGFEKYYEVSACGDVRSLDRMTGGIFGSTRLVKGMTLKHYVNRTGYPTVGLKADGRRLTRGVHQLVMLAFVGPRPDSQEVCHGDGDKMNYNLSNLRYDSRSANLYDRVAHGQNWQANKTHCKSRHEFSPENTRLDKHGRRSCRECERARSIRRSLENKGN